MSPQLTQQAGQPAFFRMTAPLPRVLAHAPAHLPP
jgi:hypothetical protein